MHERDYEGGVFSATLPDGRAGARVSVDSDAVRATTREGTSFVVPYAGLELERGGASGRMWFCRTPDRALTIFSEAPGFEQALREQARRPLGEQLERIDAQQKLSRRSTLLWVVGLLVIPALLALVGYVALKRAGHAAIDVLPRSVDEQLGAMAVENMDLGGVVVRDEVLDGAIKTMVDRLAKAGGEGYRFHVRVVDSATVNAFALPGGQVVVYTGLLRTAETPEQVAGVLAHEMAHVTKRHGMHRIAQSIGVVAGIQLLFGDVSGLFAVAVELLRQGAINSYSRDQEREADREGVRTLVAANVDPEGLAQFFELLAKRSGKLERAIAWLGTHPDLGERVEAIQRMRASLRVTPKPLAIPWKEVQRRAGKTVDAAPEP